MPKISVGVSAYNRKDYLRQTLNSLLAQRYRDFEIIVVDDGSTDGTRAMVETEFPQVRYFYKENGGDASAKNRAVAEARGEYVVFLDSDDLFFPDSLERLAALAERHPGACIYGWYNRIDENGVETPARPKILPLSSGRILGALLQHIVVTSCGVLIPRTLFLEKNGFDSGAYRVGHDYALMLRLAAEREFYPLAEPVFQRRRHGGNLSSADYAKVGLIRKVVTDFAAAFPDAAEVTPRALANRLAGLDLKLAREARKAGMGRQAVRDALRSSLRNRFSWKAFFRYLFA